MRPLRPLDVHYVMVAVDTRHNGHTAAHITKGVRCHAN
jgi:hypothetical protein